MELSEFIAKQMTKKKWTEKTKYVADTGVSRFVDAALKLTCGITLSSAEMEPLTHLHQLYIMHFSLTNDLYSYPKEYKEMVEKGSALVNGVKVLQDLLGVTPPSAKVILRTILWDLETQLDQVYRELLEEGRLNDRQLRFARSMLECLAGNTFYSATTYRYASVVPNALLTNGHA